ncbi:Manganese transport protein MntH [Acidisarcina polymorpha]|uniref:Manganese transport protein MntH n=1 Tax=Acidisarcina polymorpha TaxID=2211140 RepID=A0A2Z5FVJ7_9BACT|nr:divalent metal cation transporter [Acidisarcina polymorpha]AXC10913.1 Manganese transport protein MntH [Acidisarcina polymorpha]
MLLTPERSEVPPRRRDPVQQFFRDLGPGLITGAADDDPSGISTYSVAGAAYGYTALWTALFSFPLMAAVQLMCARLGMVTGRGLASVIRTRYPPWVLWPACGLVVIANVFNIGADLGGMANAMQMVTGVPSYFWTPLFTAIIIALLFWTSYRTIARTFKWMTLILFAYVITAFLARPDWWAVLRSTFVPHIEWTRSYVSVLVGILGTTISPYLFFWQASQEVEEERKQGKIKVAQRRGATDAELAATRTDVVTGMLFSNVVMYFIILTTAATLHAHGLRSITTAKEAAEALRPLAGQGAYWLFTLGLIGTGMLAVPVLAGSCAYAVAEGAKWRHASLGSKPLAARPFYAVIAVAMLIGLALDFAGLDAVKMLFWSAVLNGVLAPPLVVLVVLLTSDEKVMGKRTNSRPLRYLGWACAVAMGGAALALLVL